MKLLLIAGLIALSSSAQSTSTQISCAMGGFQSSDLHGTLPVQDTFRFVFRVLEDAGVLITQHWPDGSQTPLEGRIDEPYLIVDKPSVSDPEGRLRISLNRFTLLMNYEMSLHDYRLFITGHCE